MRIIEEEAGNVKQIGVWVKRDCGRVGDMGQQGSFRREGVGFSKGRPIHGKEARMDSSEQMTEVKRFLRHKVQTDIVAEYDQMIDELPGDFKSFEEAEEHFRKGTLKIAGKLLQCWVEVAERKLFGNARSRVG